MLPAVASVGRSDIYLISSLEGEGELFSFLLLLGNVVSPGALRQGSVPM